MSQIFLGSAVVDLARREVRRDGRTVRLEPRAAEVLSALAARRGSPVDRMELLDGCWSVGDGSDDALTQAIAQIRRAIGEDARAQKWVQTIPKKGYLLALEGEPADAGTGNVVSEAGKRTVSLTTMVFVGVIVAVILVAMHLSNRDVRVLERRYPTEVTPARQGQ